MKANATYAFACVTKNNQQPQLNSEHNTHHVSNVCFRVMHSHERNDVEMSGESAGVQQSDELLQELQADLVTGILKKGYLERAITSLTIAPHTCIFNANNTKLDDKKLAYFSTVERWRSDSAACNRIRALTLGLDIRPSEHKRTSRKIKNAAAHSSLLSGLSAPLCSSKVTNILRTGVAMSSAVSEDACAMHRLRQTFSDMILARRVDGMLSSSIHSFSSSISS